MFLACFGQEIPERVILSIFNDFSGRFLKRVVLARFWTGNSEKIDYWHFIDFSGRFLEKGVFGMFWTRDSKESDFRHS